MSLFLKIKSGIWPTRSSHMVRGPGLPELISTATDIGRRNALHEIYELTEYYNPCHAAIREHIEKELGLADRKH